MTRRHFINALLVLMVYGLIKPAGSAAAEPPAIRRARTGFAILQGATDETTTQLAIMVPKVQRYSYRLRIGTDCLAPSYQWRFDRASSDFGIDQVKFEGLTLKTVYTLEVLSADGLVVDERELETLDLQDKSTPFLVLSCMRDSKPQYEMDEIWDAVIANKPACMFWLGDNCYASLLGPVDGDWHWKRNVESRQRFKIFYSKRLTPTFAIWDDHDYGTNDGDHTYEHRDEALQNVQTFFAQQDMPGSYVLGPGNSAHLTAFGQEFLFMDGRFHKRTTGQDGQPSQWGMEGERWLESRLAQVRGPIWISNGTMFFKTFPISESYEKQFKKNFNSLLERLKRVPNPVVFLSGDIHFSMISRVPKEKLGYPTYELTSSGLLSFRGPLFFTPPAFRKICGVYKNNFVQVQPISVQPDKLAVEVSAFGKKNKLHFREFLAVVSS